MLLLRKFMLEDLVNHVLNTHNIEQVIHFAAQSHVQTSFSDSLQYTKDNILGTHILLECCRKCKITGYSCVN